MSMEEKNQEAINEDTTDETKEGCCGCCGNCDCDHQSEEKTDTSSGKELGEEILRNMIAKIVSEAMGSEAFDTQLDNITSLTDADKESLKKILTLSMMVSAHTAIECYDTILRQTLFNYINDIVMKHNDITGIVHGMYDTLKVHAKKIGILEDELLKTKLTESVKNEQE